MVVGCTLVDASVALADSTRLGEECETLPNHLENIVAGSHVFLAPGEPVTRRTRSVQHEILMPDRSDVDLAGWPQLVSVQNRIVLRKCYREVKLSPVIVCGLPRWSWLLGKMDLRAFVWTTAG